MTFVTLGRRLGNALYKAAFPAYLPLYSAFKAYADRAERQLLAQYLSQGTVVVDAGANIGVYSRFLSGVVGATGMVHSFEPSPDNFVRLSAAVSGLPNVRTNEMAVSNKTENKLLYISEDLNVDHRAYPTEGEPRQTISVKATALDDYFEPGSRIDLFKLDIQGYELHALHGAARVLDDNPKIKLLLELWPYGLREAGSSAEELVAFLRSRNFKIFSMSNDDLTDVEMNALNEGPSNYRNIFARRLLLP